MEQANSNMYTIRAVAGCFEVLRFELGGHVSLAFSSSESFIAFMKNLVPGKTRHSTILEKTLNNSGKKTIQIN